MGFKLYSRIKIKTIVFLLSILVLLIESKVLLALDLDEGIAGNVPSNSHVAYVGDFLTLGVGARPLSMGGSFTAIADDSTATYWNPAGLAQLTHAEMTFMQASINGLDSYSFSNYVHSLGQSRTVGLSWLRVGIDNIQQTTVKFPSHPIGPSNRPSKKSTFSAGQNAFLVSYGQQLGQLAIGVNLKMIYMTTLKHFNALGIGSDLGLLWKTTNQRSGQLAVGLVLQDYFRTRLFWNTVPQSAGQASHSESIRPNLRIGTAYHQKIPFLNSRLSLALDANRRQKTEFHFGGEYVINDLLSIRSGILQKQGSFGNIHQLTAGAGFRLAFVSGAAFAIDYAFIGHDQLGNSNRVSLILRL